MAIVTLQEVHKTYPLGKTEVHAIKGVSFEIGEGDFNFIAGPPSRIRSHSDPILWIPKGIKTEHLQAPESVQPYYEESAVPDHESRCTWARLIAQVYAGCAPRCPPRVSTLPLTYEVDCRDH